MAERFCEQAPTILAGLDQEPTWESVLALEPGVRDCLTDAEFDRACEALGDSGGYEIPLHARALTGCGGAGAGAGRRCRLIEADVTALHRAGLLHDIGRVGISASIWAKEGALSEREWEQVRLHAYYTQRVLARPDPLGRIGALASQHHERLDGSGYHRSNSGTALSPAARILTAADAYQAMTEPRAHREPLSPEGAAEELRRERPAGLSEREVEVLRLAPRGLSNRVMAEQLSLSSDTVKHHIQHIYDKAGVSTRAGATLFAMEHSLL